MLQSIILLSFSVLASVEWEGSIILPPPNDEKKSSQIGKGEYKFFLPRSKWTCYATPVKSEETEAAGRKVKRWGRDLKCVNLRDKDVFELHVRCFDMPDQLNANSVTLIDDKGQKFRVFLSCASL